MAASTLRQAQRQLGSCVTLQLHLLGLHSRERFCQ